MSNESNEIDNITLKDIETIIKILERFIRINKKAERVLKQFTRSYSRGFGFSKGDFIQDLIRETIRQRGLAEEEEYEEISEEDLDEETRRILEKII